MSKRLWSAVECTQYHLIVLNGNYLNSLKWNYTSEANLIKTDTLYPSQFRCVSDTYTIIVDVIVHSLACNDAYFVAYLRWWQKFLIHIFNYILRLLFFWFIWRLFLRLHAQHPSRSRVGLFRGTPTATPAEPSDAATAQMTNVFINIISLHSLKCTT